MPAPVLLHADVQYRVQAMYSVPDEAWYLELSETEPAPPAWADLPGAVDHLPGPSILLAVVPDEDPVRVPTVAFGGGEQVVPYPVMRWFMEHVAEEVERSRAAMAAKPGSGPATSTVPPASKRATAD
ncbi:hypothetical protein ACLQ3F_22430 [Micromonospora sp. DT15]|uniref:hypothetical protein n=1 Tax=Micromonospora sp. DT15 TaxID=3393445 RepID=UPI003CEE7F05